MQIKPIEVYKASAGSGKTYTLAEKFLKLLFENENNYRSTLAVTFTNKASNEMKQRVIREIHLLATGKSSNHLTMLMNEAKLSELEVRAKAKKIQNLILHNYSSFYFETIDSFFQRITQNFAKELGLPWNFSIELDQDMVIQEAVNLILLELDDNPRLKNDLMSYSLHKISEGKGRDITRDLAQATKELFNETYHALSPEIKEDLHDAEKLKVRFEKIRKIKVDFENTASSIAKKAFELIKNHNLQPNDFKGGASSQINQFRKALDTNKDYELKKTFRSQGSDPDNWITKTSTKKDEIREVFSAGLGKLIDEYITHIDSNMKAYQSACLLTNLSYTLPAVSDILKRINQYLRDNNIFLLAHTNSLVNSIIDNNDTPFIYEKTGTFIKNYMIDEFQDTSAMQWNNFRPLIEEAISKGGKALIVGDVKQSIYRWRNGNWKLLAYELSKTFGESLQTNVLGSNWRSYKEIINFNNTIFEIAPKIVGNLFLQELNAEEFNLEATFAETAYEAQAQNKPKQCKNGGYVEIEFRNFSEKGSKEEREEFYLQKTIEAVEKLQFNGYKAKDIAILCRGNKEAGIIIDFFNEHKQSANAKEGVNYEIISNDALSLSKSACVRILVSFLELLKSNRNSIAKIKIVNELSILSSGKSNFNLDNFNEDLLKTIEKKYKNKTLFEICEFIIISLQLNSYENELPFIQAFLDSAIHYSSNKTASIYAFLHWWKESGHKKSITLSENQDAIALTTIHKSKGLEFENVIVPFLEEKLFDTSHMKTPTVWASCDEAPFNEFKILPIKLKSEAKGSYYDTYYYAEQMQSYIDSLNLLYVAFTRAEKNLFVYGNIYDKQSKNIAWLLAEAIGKSDIYLQNIDEHFISAEDYWDTENLQFRYGELGKKNAKETALSTTISPKHPSSTILHRIVFSTHGRSFFEDFNSKDNQRTYGNIMHEIMENIAVASDIDGSVSRAYFEGKISRDDRQVLSRLISEKLSMEPYASWFAEGLTIKNEISLLTNEGKVKRPDRVILHNDKTATIIDYKFGEKEETHRYQMLSYQRILKQMGIDSKGYIWYFEKNEVEEV